ncbi:hypothetical protein [Flavobacterium sp. B17]|uniref:hypothetical protein n=1 Tax=Flavobacterium sp. B17 TaxID=95618 RepID=UPI0003482F54|nr:hypothetical protein [Flavobacterium sp. B17]
MSIKYLIIPFFLFSYLYFGQIIRKTPPPPPPKDYIYFDINKKGVFAINKEYNALNYKSTKNEKTGNISYVGGISNEYIIPLEIVTITSKINQGSLNYDNISEYLKKIPIEQRERIKNEFYNKTAVDIKTKYNLENLISYGSKKNSLGQYYNYYLGDSTKENYIFVFAIFRNNFKVHNLFLYYSKSESKAKNVENQKKVDNFINSFWIYNDSF